MFRIINHCRNANYRWTADSAYLGSYQHDVILPVGADHDNPRSPLFPLIVVANDDDELLYCSQKSPNDSPSTVTFCPIFSQLVFGVAPNVPLWGLRKVAREADDEHILFISFDLESDHALTRRKLSSKFDTQFIVDKASACQVDPSIRGFDRVSSQPVYVAPDVLAASPSQQVAQRADYHYIVLAIARVAPGEKIRITDAGGFVHCFSWEYGYVQIPADVNANAQARRAFWRQQQPDIDLLMKDAPECRRKANLSIAQRMLEDEGADIEEDIITGRYDDPHEERDPNSGHDRFDEYAEYYA